MLDPEIEKLLILQDRDTRLMQCRRALKSFPDEQSKLEAAEAAQRKKRADAEAGLKALTVKRDSHEQTVAQLREKVVKFKTQQMEVKKTDEYEALNHEIQHAEDAISREEEAELAVMFEMDEARDALAQLRTETENELARLEKEKALLRERKEQAESEISELEAAVEEARQAVSPAFLKAYDQAKTNLREKPPFVAPVENGICRRSGMRVSNERLSEAKAVGMPAFDDHTGCVIYVDA
ncbi:MAG: zinc ribbon domain-containing protein [Opitutales bacterium]